MAGATRRRHRQPRSAPAFIPLAIGTRVPPSAPSPRSPDTPPRDPRAWQGQDSTQSPLPPRPPSFGARMRGGRGEGQGWRQRLDPPHPTPGAVGSTPRPTRHVQHRAQPPLPSRAPLPRRVGTGTDPAPAGPREMLAEREELPAPSHRHRRGRSPALGAGWPPARPAPGASVCNALYIDELQPLKLLNPCQGQRDLLGTA
ncbi:hypothetical protein Nmel_014214, partial [Mimus melanotis]